MRLFFQLLHAAPPSILLWLVLFYAGILAIALRNRLTAWRVRRYGVAPPPRWYRSEYVVMGFLLGWLASGGRALCSYLLYGATDADMQVWIHRVPLSGDLRLGYDMLLMNPFLVGLVLLFQALRRPGNLAPGR